MKQETGRQEGALKRSVKTLGMYAGDRSSRGDVEPRDTKESYSLRIRKQIRWSFMVTKRKRRNEKGR